MDSSIISPWNRPQVPRPPPPILAPVLANLYAECAASPAGGALGVPDAAAGAGAGSEAAESARGEGGGVFGGVSEVPSEEEGEEEPMPSKERCAAVALSPLAARFIRPVAANSWPGEAVGDAAAIAGGAAPLRRRAPGGGRGGWQAEGVAGARAGSGAGVIDQR